ncbi:QueT transporter family protein [Xylocopilactobacillus apicola]|uniref:Membrane protein n=1 Tax=Xylocopilactobacillus apicola TaxID=2932184 RepID=A0AAU9CV58_9LACO|nr:QueT transporter family protein [Xylocopilactobacillus apicola]BDR57877.1 membrane protein [Xylocopilactobacillus apicola]
MSVKNIAKLAVVAALYAVLTLFLPNQFGPVQFRLAEALDFLIFYDYRYAYALGVGCAIANISSPMFLDVIVGTAQTVLVLLFIYFITKKMKSLLAKYITLDVVFSLSMFIIAWELWFQGLVKSSALMNTYVGLVLWEGFVLTITGVAMYLVQKQNLVNLYLD